MCEHAGLFLPSGPQTESCHLRRRFPNPLKIQCSDPVTKMASRLFDLAAAGADSNRATTRESKSVPLLNCSKGATIWCPASNPTPSPFFPPNRRQGLGRGADRSAMARRSSSNRCCPMSGRWNSLSAPSMASAASRSASLTGRDLSIPLLHFLSSFLPFFLSSFLPFFLSSFLPFSSLTRCPFRRGRASLRGRRGGPPPDGVCCAAEARKEFIMS